MGEYQVVPKQRVAFNVTARNARKTISRCLDSLVGQSNQDWICVVTDDASNDATPTIIRKYVSMYPDHIVGVLNRKRRWKMFNFAAAMARFEPSDIVCELDGDDYVAHDTVVEEIQRLHQRYDVVWTQHSIDATYCPDWHTWQSTNLPDHWSRSYPERSRIWTASRYPGHMRTFKRVFFDQISEEHLKYQDQWLKVTSDVAYFTPILEMVPAHLRYFYDRVCYVYTITEHNDTLHEWSSGNRQSKGSDPSEFQSEIGNYIRTLPAYETIRTSLCVCVVSEDAVSRAVTLVKEVRLRLPFMRFHLFLERERDIHLFRASLNTYALHLYDLEQLVNNSLSAIQRDLGQVTLGGSNTAYFYPYCIKYVQENHVADDLFFVDSSVSLDAEAFTPFLRMPGGTRDESGTCLYWDCSPESLAAVSKMHRENLIRFKTGSAPLTLAELCSDMTTQRTSA